MGKVIEKIKKSNWRTTTLGAIGGTLFTTSVAALASPEVMATLQAAGVNPLYLAIAGGIVKVIRDVRTKDATLGN